MAEDPSKVRAEIRARQAEDGRKAMAEYEANAAAMRVKTEKLRALRLAREAEEALRPVEPKKKAKTASKSAAAKSPGSKSPGAKASKTKKAKAPVGKLSDWLDDQSDSGHRT